MLNYKFKSVDKKKNKKGGIKMGKCIMVSVIGIILVFGGVFGIKDVVGYPVEYLPYMTAQGPTPGSQVSNYVPGASSSVKAKIDSFLKKFGYTIDDEGRLVKEGNVDQNDVEVQSSSSGENWTVTSHDDNGLRFTENADDSISVSESVSRQASSDESDADTDDSGKVTYRHIIIERDRQGNIIHKSVRGTTETADGGSKEFTQEIDIEYSDTIPGRVVSQTIESWDSSAPDVHQTQIVTNKEWNSVGLVTERDIYVEVDGADYHETGSKTEILTYDSNGQVSEKEETNCTGLFAN